MSKVNSCNKVNRKEFNVGDFKGFKSTHASRMELMDKLNGNERKMFSDFVKSVGV